MIMAHGHNPDPNPNPAAASSPGLGREGVTSHKKDLPPPIYKVSDHALSTYGVSAGARDLDTDSEGVDQGEITYDVPTVAEILVSLQGSTSQVLNRSASAGNVQFSPAHAPEGEGEDNTPPQSAHKEVHVALSVQGALQLGDDYPPAQSDGPYKKQWGSADCTPWPLYMHSPNDSHHPHSRTHRTLCTCHPLTFLWMHSLHHRT